MKKKIPFDLAVYKGWGKDNYFIDFSSTTGLEDIGDIVDTLKNLKNGK